MCFCNFKVSISEGAKLGVESFLYTSSYVSSEKLRTTLSYYKHFFLPTKLPTGAKLSNFFEIVALYHFRSFFFTESPISVIYNIWNFQREDVKLYSKRGVVNLLNLANFADVIYHRKALWPLSYVIIWRLYLHFSPAVGAFLNLVDILRVIHCCKALWPLIHIMRFPCLPLICPLMGIRLTHSSMADLIMKLISNDVENQ